MQADQGDIPSGETRPSRTNSPFVRVEGALRPDDPLLQLRWVEQSAESPAPHMAADDEELDELAESDLLLSEDDSDFGRRGTVPPATQRGIPRQTVSSGPAGKVPPPVPRDVTGDFQAANTDQIPTRKIPKPDFEAVSQALYASDDKVVTTSSVALDSSEMTATVPLNAVASQPSSPPPITSAPADELSALMQNIVSEEKPTGARSGSSESRISAESWYAEVFDDLYLRLLPPNMLSRTRREVEFLTRELRLGPQSSVLDLACGHGRHSVELASRGVQMTGVDLSRVFLERALREAERRGVETRFMVGDMRDINFDARFDAAFCFGTSFGYFDDRTNFEVVSALFRSLKPGGRLVIETVNRDYITQHVPRRRWWDIEELIVMEEVDFNARTSRLGNQRTIVDGSTRPWEQHISVRLYAAHELCSMLAMAGFQLLSLCGDIAHPGVFMASLNRSVIVTAQRPG